MRRLWLVTFVLVLAAGQAAVGMRAADTASVTGDEPFYLVTTQSLVSDGDLDLRDEYADRSEMDRFWDGRVPLWKQMEPTADGRLLSPHDPGLSVLIAPAYVLGGLRGVQRFLVVLWAAAMACAALLAARAGAPRGAAGFAAVVLGAGAPGIVYASQVYPEGPAALAVALALLLATASRPRPVALAVVLVGLVWLGVKYAPFGAVAAVVWAWRFRGDRRALAVAAGLGAAGAVSNGWWHLHTFGGLTPYATNVVYAGDGTARILERHVRIPDRSYRLYGLFLDARFGLFRWLPAAVLAVWGVGRRSLPALATLAVAVLLGTFVSITMMGWWFPGRMLVAAFPGLVVLVALGTARLPRTAMALGAWSLAIAAALAVSARTGGVRLAVDPFTLGAPLPPAIVFPDFRSFGVREVALSAAWIGGLALLRLASARRARAARVDPGPA